jgi:hypothetical protein
MKKKKLVSPPRKNGLFNKDAPFWRGERAEHIVKARVEGYKRKPRKKRQ